MSGGSPAAVAAGLTETAALSAAGATMQASEQAAHAVIPQRWPPHRPLPRRYNVQPHQPAHRIHRQHHRIPPRWRAPNHLATQLGCRAPRWGCSRRTRRPGHLPRRQRPPRRRWAGLVATGGGAADPRGHPDPDCGITPEISRCGQRLSRCGFNQLHPASGNGFSPPAVKRPGIGAPAGMLTTATLHSPVTAAPNSTVQPFAYVHPQPPRPGGASSPSPPSTSATLPTPSTPHPNLRRPRHRPPTRLHHLATHPVPPPVATVLTAPGAPAPRCWTKQRARHPKRHQCCHRLHRTHRFRRHRLRRQANRRWAAPIPPWASPPPPPSLQATRDAYNKLTNDIDHHNLNPPNPSDWNAVQAYNQEAWYNNTLKTQLERQLNAANAQYTPANDAKRADIPYWTQPAPQQPRQTTAAGSEPQVPQNVQSTLNQIDSGRWPQAANAPGTKGGSVFRNVTPDGQHPLPTTDASGEPITYQAWDVNPRVPDQDRDDERIVTGSDGSAWYTTDHYGTFHRIR
ncbi:ribonuclease family protein [Mycobacterium kansasii 824]|nr:ribonuclease family protein [Mycobacterium kansasii 824]